MSCSSFQLFTDCCPHSDDEGTQGFDSNIAIPILIAIYGISAMAFGIAFVAVINDPEIFQDMADSVGVFDQNVLDQAKSTLLIDGAMSILSGAAAILSALLFFLKRYWVVSVISCAMASLLAIGFAILLVGIILFIIGLVMTYQIYRNKMVFRS